PALAKDETQLGPANSAWATIQNFSYIVGPAIGGIVLALGSVTSAFSLNAVSFIAIAIILWFLPPSRAKHEAGPPPEGEASGDGGEAAAATAGASPATSRLQRRPIAGLGVIQIIGGFLGGGFQVITVVLALDILKA